MDEKEKGDVVPSLVATVDAYQAGGRTVQFQRPRRTATSRKQLFKLAKSRSSKLKPRPLGKWCVDYEVNDEALPRTIDLFLQENDWEIDTLELIFENKEETGGGVLEEVIYEQGSQLAVLTFQKDAAVDRIIFNKDKIQEEYSITVQRHENPKQESTDTNHSEDENEDTVREIIDNLPVDLVEVAGMPDSVTPEEVIRFFENQDLSGGGTILHAIHDEDAYLLTFKASTDARRMILSHMDMPFILGGQSLSIRAVDTKLLQKYPYGTIASSAIAITRIPGNLSKDEILERLIKYGDFKVVESILSRKASSMIVVFANPRDAETMFRHLLQNPISTDKTKLGVQLLFSKNRPSLVLFENVSTHQFVLQKLPNDITETEVSNYFFISPMHSVKKVVFGLKIGAAYIEFHNNTDFDDLYYLTLRKPLKGNFIMIDRIPEVLSVEIHGESANKLHKDIIEIAFQEKVTHMNRQHEGVLVAHLQEISDNQIKRAKKHELLQGYEIQYHYGCLGIIPLGHDTSRSFIKQPPDVSVDLADPLLVRFITVNDEHKVEIEKEMDELHAFITWPVMGSKLKPVILSCITQNITFELVEKWTTIAPKEFRKLLRKFTSRHVVIGEKGREKCMAKMKIPMKKQPTSLVDYDISDDNSSIVIYGVREYVEEQHQEMEMVCNTFAKDLEDRSNLSKAQLTGITKALMNFLETKNVFVDLLNQYTTVEIEHDEVGSILTLWGLEEEPGQAEKILKKEISQVATDIITVSRAKHEIITSVGVQRTLANLFTLDKCRATYHIEEGSIKFYGRNVKDIQAAKGFISNNVVEKIIFVRDASKYYLGYLEWDQFCKDLKARSPGNIAIDVAVVSGKITCAVVPKEYKISTIIQDIESCLLKKEIIRTTVGLQKNVLKLVMEYRQKQLHSMSSALVLGEMEENTNESCIRFEGTRESVEMATVALKTVLDAHRNSRHKINKIGIPRYMYHDNGRAKIAHLQTEHKVIIEVIKGDAATDTTTGSKLNVISAPVVSSSKVHQTVCKVPFRSVTIMLIEGDITEYRCDVVVNSANGKLDHIGGVAKAIVDKGGQDIQMECKRHIQKIGRDKTPGEVYVSNAGNLPCRRIVHAVIPRWKEGKNKEVQNLYDAVLAALSEAEKLKMASVALPAMGAGIYAFPEQLTAIIIINAVNDFVHSSKNVVTGISLVDVNANIIKAFAEILPDAFVNVETFKSLVEGDEKYIPMLRLENNGERLRTTEGMELSFKVGDLISEQVDAIVNVTSTHFDTGTIFSKNIFSKTSSIKKECKRLYPNGIAPKDVVATGFGQKTIYHAATSNITTDPQVLKRLVIESLKVALGLANAAKTSRLCIPALWSGHKHTEQDVRTVVDEVIQTIATFSRLHHIRNLQQVAIVTPKHTMITKVCKEAFKDASKTDESTKTNKTHAIERKPEKPRKSLFGIKVADIASEKADVIVNTTSKDLDLSSAGNVSQSLLAVAGPELQQECKRLKPKGLDFGEIAVTKGYNLQCTNVYHGACPSWGDDAPEALRTFVKNCLDRAHTDKMGSIHFPAIATGGLQYPPDVVGQIIVSAIKLFREHNPQSTLKDITVICMPDDAYVIQAFKDAMREHKDETLDVDGECFTAEGIHIQFYTDGLTTIQANAILNSTNCNLDLTYGKISPQVLLAAGPQLQNECNQIAPNGIDYGDVIMTKGYKLPCKYVFHCACPSWDRSTSPKVLDTIVQNTLEQAAKLGLKSVAFPAIGTKGLRYPVQEVAEIMINACERFSQENTKTSITDIYFAFLQKDKDIYEAFKVKCISRFGSNHAPTLESEQREEGHTQENPTEDPDESGDDENSMEEPDEILDDFTLTSEKANLISQSTESCKCYIGQILVEVIQERVNKLQVDTLFIGIRDGKPQKKSQLDYGKMNVSPYRLRQMKKDASERKEWRNFIRASLCEANQKKNITMGYPAFESDNSLVKTEDVAEIVIQSIADEETKGFCTNIEYILIGAENSELFEIYKNELVHCAEISVLVFDINAFEQEAIDEVTKEIDTICEKESVTVSISDELKDEVAHLTNKQVQVIRDLQKQHHLRVIINKKKSEMKVEGLLPDIETVKQYLREVKIERLKEERDTIIAASQVQWYYYEEDGEASAFTQIANREIERAFQEQIKKVWIDVFEDGRKFIIDVKHHRMTCDEDEDTKEIKRVIIDKEDMIPPPKDWAKVPPEETYITDPLHEKKKEYLRIAAAFRKSMGKNVKIHSIERIQNPLLYKRYMVKKKAMEKLGIKKPEKLLWHGTSSSSLHGINRDGFNRSLCGVNGTLYGKGVYFARDAHYSDKFAAKQSGHRSMYYAQVLVGRYANSSRDMKCPPPLEKADGLYNSVVDNVNDPSIFVIFFDDQVYPGHLITYEEY